ncbi:hypothetical protein ACFL1R_02110 [Candidatus Latescibacterota bacterium]
MNIGQFDLNGDKDIVSRRRRSETDQGSGSGTFYHDLPRLILLLVMLLAAIFGRMYFKNANQPIKIVGRSLKKSVNHSFHASLEGTTRLRNAILGNYRNRQQYTPDRGLSKSPEKNLKSQNRYPISSAPFDALSAIESLHYAQNIFEHNKEDMYGHGTRHFSGLLHIPGSGDSLGHMFEYWINMRTLLPVKLTISRVERNVDVNKYGEPISRTTFLNIRYHNWR